MKSIQKILVIRFRQIGDSILAAALCSTLKRSFPKAEVHIVLNSGIAPIFEGHPDIDKVITFAKDENKPFVNYLKKVWTVMHEHEYDVIVDMRSTIRTLLFSLFSLHTPFRIGRPKSYTHFLLNKRVNVYEDSSLDMVQCNHKYLLPLQELTTIGGIEEFRLYLKEEEKKLFRAYMESQGIDFSRPVMLVGVTTKLLHKKWKEASMKSVLQSVLDRYKDWQLIFNYAPGVEEEDARRMYRELGSPEAIKIDVQAKSLRELMALCANCSFYFGNEGGSRHMVQALGVPSLAIFSPNAHKSVWLPKNSVPAEGICPEDMVSSGQMSELSYDEKFDLITPEAVCDKLFPLMDRCYSSANSSL